MESKPNLVELPIEAIRPNPFNPNRMSRKDFDSYKAEVKRLGHLPKPTVVRPVGNKKYEVVDGEHGWRAAKELGMKTVRCEVRELNDFDARRECFKRNRGGQDDPVALGRMFQQMMGDQNLPQRALATTLGISEGAVRKKIDYVKAAEVRTLCAPSTADADIARLTHCQVRMYLDLPESIHDPWLDSGADLDAFRELNGWPRVRVAYEIHRYKLGEFLDTTSRSSFQDSVTHLAGLCMWGESHRVENLADYLRAVGSLGLSAEVLDLLPLEMQGERCRPLLTLGQWRKVLTSAKKRTQDLDGLFAQVQAGVNLALRKAGHDLGDVLGADIAEALQIVQDAPAYIRDADFLELAEKRLLAEVALDVDEELVEAAKQQTVTVVQQQRQQVAGEPRRRGKKATVASVFEQCLKELFQNNRSAQFDELFADEEVLFECVVDRLAHIDAIKQGMVGGESAAAVLAERLNALEWPEFYILAAGVLEVPIEDAAARWVLRMGDLEPDGGTD